MKFKTRTRKEMEQELCVAWDKVWYDRHQVGMQKRYPKDKNLESRKAYKRGEKAAKKMEKEYGKRNLGPYTKFEWGMLNGRFETLRWVLGEDWGILDT
ncbi:MAG: hypothetical protein WC839_01865 [Candidatus Paceibacterota bacterium]